MSTTSSPDWKRMEEPKDSGPVLDTMVQSLPSSSTIPSDWSISSPHTMPKPPTKPEVKEIPEPEIDLIDGVTFRSFESWQEMLEYTQKEERSRKMVQNKKSVMSGKRKSENRSSDASKTRSRLSLDSALKAVNNKSNSTKSAFVSDLLDDYLNQTKKDLKGKKYRDPEYFGAPPEDSKIYSTGILNMDSVKKKPFPALPKVSNESENSKPDNKPDNKPENKPDNKPENSVSKLKCSSKQPLEESLGNHSRGSRVKGSKGKPGASSGLSESREVAFEELMAATFADIQARKRQWNPSIRMDEPYVRFAIESVRFSMESARFAMESARFSMESARVGSKNSPKVEVEEKDDASDVAKMISRHSKRDIRLPARYHNSNIMIGNEWVTASVDPVSEKKGRKRLVEEQKRLFKMMEQVQCPSPKKKKSCDGPSARMMKELQTKVRLDRERTMKELQTKVRPDRERTMKVRPDRERMMKVRPDCEEVRPDHKEVRLDHKEVRPDCELQKPKREKQPLPKVETCPNSSPVAKPSTLPPDRVVSSGRTLPVDPVVSSGRTLPVDPVISSGRTLPVDPVISSGKSVMGSQIKVINQELKELYRNLYFENVPERRIHFQMKGIKPRVNKHQAVEEAIQVLEKLKKRESQLAYIHKLMSIWNNKLELCRKVMMKEVEPEPTADGKDYVNVVANVLKAYQSSICYKVQEALTKNECGEDPNEEKLGSKASLPSPRVIGTSLSKKDPVQNDDPSKGLISPSESQPRIIGYRAVRKNGLITETSTGKNGLVSETSAGKPGHGKNGLVSETSTGKEPVVNGRKRGRSESGSATGKSESLLLPRQVPGNVIHLTPESYTSHPVKMIRLAGPRGLNLTSRKGFISVTPASFKSTSNGPIVQLDPKECSPNAFAIKLNGPPVTASGHQIFSTFKKKPGNLVPVSIPHPIPTGPSENTLDAPPVEAVTSL